MGHLDPLIYSCPHRPVFLHEAPSRPIRGASAASAAGELTLCFSSSRIRLTVI